MRSIRGSSRVTSINQIEAVVKESNREFTVVKEGSLSNEDSHLANVKRIP